MGLFGKKMMRQSVTNVI